MREVLPERCTWLPRTMGHILSHNNFPSSLFSIIYNGRNSYILIHFCVIYIYSNIPSSLFPIIDHEFWSIVLDDHWSKTIYRPEMIVWSSAIIHPSSFWILSAYIMITFWLHSDYFWLTDWLARGGWSSRTFDLLF